MRKNKMMRLASCLLVAVLLTTSMISGTFAKYVSEATGTDSARVAKWSIKVEGTEIGVAGDTTVDFNLFDTIYDTDGSGEETDVAKGVGETIIAPGTKGSFELNIENLSEVDAAYLINLSATNDNDIPILYSLDGSAWTDNIGTLVVSGDIDMGTSASSTTVYWKWDYYTSDAADLKDTQLGHEAATGTPAKVIVTADITVTQID